MTRRSSSGAKVWKSTENVSKMYQKSSKCIELLFELAIWKSRQKLWNLESWRPKSAFRPFLLILFRKVNKILGQTRSRLNTLHQTWIRSIKMSLEEKPSALSLKNGSCLWFAKANLVAKPAPSAPRQSEPGWIRVLIKDNLAPEGTQHPIQASKCRRTPKEVDPTRKTPYSQSTRRPYLSRYVR